MELSIIIPCYNEEKRLHKSIKRISNYLQQRKIVCEIIFVNDGSKDNTQKIINNFVQQSKKFKRISVKIKINEENRGKGHAVKTGLKTAKGKYILLCDADLSTPIEELDKFLLLSKEYDLVIGSRKQSDSQVILPQSRIRTLLGKSFSAISKFILNVKVNDFTCGFKLIKNKQAKIISQKMTIERWAYDSEMLKIATVNKMKIKETGVRWSNEANTKVRLSVDILSSLRDLLQITINSLLKKYAASPY